MTETEMLVDKTRHLAFEAGLSVLVEKSNYGRTIGVAYRRKDGSLNAFRFKAVAGAPAMLIDAVQHDLRIAPTTADLEAELRRVRGR